MSEPAERQHVSTGNPFELNVRFSRVVRVGNTVWTAGTLSNDADGTIHGTDSYEQCVYILEKLKKAMAEAGAGLEHVVKTVAYIVSTDDAEGYFRAHAEYFAEVLPVATCVVVSALLHPAARVELELVAVVP